MVILEEKEDEEENKDFHKESSVFKLWIKDNQKILRDSAEYDMKYWKVPKFVKDQEDLRKCE